MPERLHGLGDHLRRQVAVYVLGIVVFVLSPVPSLAADLVTTGEIANGAVTTPKLAADSVVSGKILNETVAGVDIRNGTVSGADVKDGSIAAADVQDGSIDTYHIAEETIEGFNVADGTLSGEDIGDGSIEIDELAPSAQGAKVTRYSLGPHNFYQDHELQLLLPGQWVPGDDAVASSAWSAMMSVAGTFVAVPGSYYDTYYQLVVTDGGGVRITNVEGPGDIVNAIYVFRTQSTSTEVVAPQP